MTLNTSSSIVGSESFALAAHQCDRDEASQNAHAASLVSSRDALQSKFNDVESQPDSTQLLASTATAAKQSVALLVSSASLACTQTVRESKNSVNSQAYPQIVDDRNADRCPPVITVSGPYASQDYLTAAALVGSNGGENAREIQDILSLTDPRVVGTSSPARAGPSVSPQAVSVSSSNSLPQMQPKRKAEAEIEIEQQNKRARTTTESENETTDSASTSSESGSRESLRAHIEELLASSAPYDPKLHGNVEIPESILQVRRGVLTTAYKLDYRQMLVRITRARNPQPPGTLEPQERPVIFSNLERNPDLMRKPGDPGVLFTANSEAEMTLDRCSVFVKLELKNACWDYMGEYKIFPRSKIGGMGQGRGWYEQLPARVHWFMENDLRHKNKHRFFRQRVAQRLGRGPSSLTYADCGAAVVNGDEEINLVFLECIGYDEYFANDILKHLNQQAAEKALADGERTHEARMEIDQKGDGSVASAQDAQTAYIASLKSSRDALRLNLDDAQRQIHESERKTLEEKIQKERMQNEIADMRIELEMMQAQWLNHQSNRTRNADTTTVPFLEPGRSSRNFKDASCQVCSTTLNRGNVFVSRRKANFIGIVSVDRLTLPHNHSTSVTATAEQSATIISPTLLARAQRIRETKDSIKPQALLQKHDNTSADRLGDALPPVFKPSASHDHSTDVASCLKSEEVQEIKEIFQHAEKQHHSVTRFPHSVHRAGPLIGTSSPGNARSSVLSPKSVRVTQTMSSSSHAPLQMQPKRKVEAETDSPQNIKRARTIAESESEKSEKKTLSPMVQRTVSASALSSGSRDSLRMHIKKVLASSSPYRPEIHGKAGHVVQVRRDLLNAAYKIGTQQMLVRISKTQNPLPPGTIIRRERSIIFPNLDRNPDLMRKPGDPGILFTARPEAEMTLDKCSVFVKMDSKTALWDYMGEYKILPRSKIGGVGQGRGWYEQLPEKVRKSVESDILGKAKHKHYRERIAQRLDLTPAAITAADVGAAMVKGDEEINLIFLECIGYDEHFANDMLKHLNQKAAEET
ncbi:hypothetical protein EV360DRAFT_89528 [Lentinula raphanica]|nr:hypothetical protein EV360DRAFT_89528 [Lentinula raphanica]